MRVDRSKIYHRVTVIDIGRSEFELENIKPRRARSRLNMVVGRKAAKLWKKKYDYKVPKPLIQKTNTTSKSKTHCLAVFPVSWVDTVVDLYVTSACSLGIELYARNKKRPLKVRRFNMVPSFEDARKQS